MIDIIDIVTQVCRVWLVEGDVSNNTESKRGKQTFSIASLPRVFTMSIGVPIKLLHEAQGHVITLELNNGTVYRGKLSEGW